MELLELHEPEETLRMCDESPAFRKICDDPEFRKRYIEENHESMRKLLEKDPFRYPEWVKSAIDRGMFSLDFAIGFACLRADLKLLDELMIKQSDTKQLFSYITTFGFHSIVLLERFLKWTLIKVKSRAKYNYIGNSVVYFSITARNYDIIRYLIAEFPLNDMDQSLMVRSILSLKDKHLNILMLIPLEQFNYDNMTVLLLNYITNNRYELFKYIVKNIKMDPEKVDQLKKDISTLVLTRKVVINRNMLELLYSFIDMSEEQLLTQFLGTQTNFNWVVSKMTKVDNVIGTTHAVHVFSDVAEPYHAFFSRLDVLGAPEDSRIGTFIISIPANIGKELLRYESFTKNASVNRLFLLKYG